MKIWELDLTEGKKYRIVGKTITFTVNKWSDLIDDYGEDLLNNSFHLSKILSLEFEPAVEPQHFKCPKCGENLINKKYVIYDDKYVELTQPFCKCCESNFTIAVNSENLTYEINEME